MLEERDMKIPKGGTKPWREGMNKLKYYGVRGDQLPEDSESGWVYGIVILSFIVGIAFIILGW